MGRGKNAYFPAASVNLDTFPIPAVIEVWYVSPFCASRANASSLMGPDCSPCTAAVDVIWRKRTTVDDHRRGTIEKDDGVLHAVGPGGLGRQRLEEHTLVLCSLPGNRPQGSDH